MEGGRKLLPGDSLQQVAGRAPRECADDVFGTIRAAEDDDHRRRRRFRYPTDRVQALERQLDLDGADVWFQSGRGSDCRSRVRRLGDHAIAVFLERVANELPVREVVVGKDDRKVLRSGRLPFVRRETFHRISVKTPQTVCLHGRRNGNIRVSAYRVVGQSKAYSGFKEGGH